MEELITKSPKYSNQITEVFMTMPRKYSRLNHGNIHDQDQVMKVFMTKSRKYSRPSHGSINDQVTKELMTK